MKLIIVILIIEILPNLALAQQLLIFGGNCEEEKGRLGTFNIFYESIAKTSKSFANAGWNVDTLYDNDAYIMKSAIRNKEVTVTLSTKIELLKKLDSYIQGAKKLTAGKQLLIAMNSHGSQGGICLQDGTLSYDDKDLNQRLAALKSKGIQLAFVDDSCYSGSSIQPLSKYGCVITSQTSNALSYGNQFMNALSSIFDKSSDELQQVDLPKYGDFTNSKDRRISMDEFYLLALNKMSVASHPNLPQISSYAEGQEQFSSFFDYFRRVKTIEENTVSNCEHCSSNQDIDLPKNLTDIVQLLSDANLQKTITPFMNNLKFETPKSLELKIRSSLQLYEKMDDEYKNISKERNDLIIKILQQGPLSEVPINLDISAYAKFMNPQSSWKSNMISDEFLVSSVEQSASRTSLKLVLTELNFSDPQNIDTKKFAKKILEDGIKEGVFKKMSDEIKNILSQGIEKGLNTRISNRYEHLPIDIKQKFISSAPMQQRMNQIGIRLNEIERSFQQLYDGQEVAGTIDHLHVVQGIGYLKQRQKPLVQNDQFQKFKNCSDFTIRKF